MPVFLASPMRPPTLALITVPLVLLHTSPVGMVRPTVMGGTLLAKLAPQPAPHVHPRMSPRLRGTPPIVLRAPVPGSDSTNPLMIYQALLHASPVGKWLLQPA